MENTKANTDQIGFFADTVRQLASARDVAAVAGIVKHAARVLVKADGAAFVLREGEFCVYLTEDQLDETWKGRKFPVNDCVCGQAMLSGGPVVVKDIGADERVRQEFYRPGAVKSVAVVPVRTNDPVAAIPVYWSRVHEPAEEDLRLLQSLADITAVTIENIAIHDHLENRVKERTLELEQVNRDLESFAYSIAHDLRAPLRAINGFLNIIREDHGETLNEATVGYMDKVLRNASQMSLLIEGLLEFMKTGRKEIRKTKVNSLRIVQDLCEEIQAGNKAQNVSISIGDLPEVEADQMLLKQVWMNLVTNAVKYSTRKERALIRIGATDSESGPVFFVADNGAGFDMNYAHKLFGVFQRLHSHREFEGTGIGLAIAEKIVSKHGGRIWAEGVVGEGATFFFTLGAGNK